MDKRTFLTTAAMSAVTFPSVALSAQQAAPASGPTVLTVTGAIGKGNRGPIDPVRDQMLKKQGIQFDKAHAFDYATVSALPSTLIKPTVEYDGKVHELRGPLLTDVIKAAGATINDNSKILLRAIDGYAVQVSAADVRKYRFIVATRIDGSPLALGGLGPLWAVIDADRFPDLAGKPLNERFGLCPWGLYHIEVQ